MTRTVGKHRATSTRSIHLIDIENQVSGRVTPEAVRAFWTEYNSTVGVDRDDAVWVGVARANAAAAAFNLPANVSRLIGKDVHNGADIALADAIDVHYVALRFERAYLVTCDHYFAEIACQLRAAGVEVVQVIGSSMVSAELYRACPTNVYLPSARVAPLRRRVPQRPVSASRAS